MKHVFFRVSDEIYEAWAVIATREGRSVPNLVKWWATQSGLDDELTQLAPPVHPLADSSFDEDRASRFKARGG